MAEPVSLSIAAPAKLNLWLEVVGRRPDGYHLLDSLVVFCSLSDRLSVEADDALSLTVSGPFAAELAADEDNLVLRAAELLRRNYAISQGAKFQLEKHIPVAAGLGGGSADAAAALHLLAQLWKLAISPTELARQAVALGADVPVCVAGNPSHVGGIGDRLRPVRMKSGGALLLVNPDQPVSTKAVFEQLRAPQGVTAPAADAPVSIDDYAGLSRLLHVRRNDLQAAALSLCPAIGDVLRAIAQTSNCDIARMSGSGATCFGLFPSSADAAAAEDTVALAHPDWWVTAADILSAEAPV